MMLTISKWFFLLLVVSLPLVRPFNLSFFDLLVPYTDFIFLISLGFWIIAVIRGETSVRIERLFVLIGFYAIAFTVSTVFSVEPKTSFFKLLGEYYLFTLCFLTFNLVQDERFLKHVVFAWLIGTGLTVLASVSGFTLFYLGFSSSNNYFLSHFGSLPAGNYPRIRALFANANMLCNFLNVSVVLNLLALKRRWIRQSVALILLAGILFAALFSISPGLGGIALSVGLWFWVSGSNRWFAKPAFVFGVFFALAVFTVTLISPDSNNTTQKFRLPFTEKKIEPSVRVLVWENTLETVRRYPWFGIGTGIDVAHVNYETLSGDRQILGDAHNMWLNLLGQTGFFGLAAFMLMLGYVIKRCDFNISNVGDKQSIRFALSCAFVGAFLYQGLSGSFEDARHLWILVGLLAASSSDDTNGSKNDISEESKML